MKKIIEKINSVVEQVKNLQDNNIIVEVDINWNVKIEEINFNKFKKYLKNINWNILNILWNKVYEEGWYYKNIYLYYNKIINENN